MFSGIKSDSAENLLHKPTIIPALLLKYFTDVFVAWKSDVYCSHFTGSKTGVEGLVSHHASGASVPVGSREGLSLTVKVNRGEKKPLCLLFYYYVGFTCCCKCCTKWKVYVVMLPNWVAHRLYSGCQIPMMFLRWRTVVQILLLVQTVTSWY